MAKKLTSEEIEKNKQLVLADMKRVISETGSITFKTYKECGKYSECFFNRYLGNWSKAMAIIGIKPENKRFITKEEIINDVLKVFRETANTTRENYLRYGNFSRAPIRRMFGGWNNLLKVLNIDINMHKNISRENVIEDVINVKNRSGKSFNAMYYRKHGKYSQPVIDRLFGNHTLLMKELGFDYDNRFVTDEEINNDLLRIYNEYEVISQDIINNDCIVHSATVRNRFGDIKKHLESIGIPESKYRKMSKLQQYVLGICRDLLGDNYVLEKGFEWLRYDKTGCKQKIDIYYPNINLAIEVDGKQHDEKCSWGEFETIKDRDRCKNELLEKHEIPLIRINHKDSKKVIIDKINQFLYTKQIA